MTSLDSVQTINGRGLIAPAAVLLVVFLAQILGGALSAEWALGTAAALGGVLGVLMFRRQRGPRFTNDPFYVAVEALFLFAILACLCSAVLAWTAGPIRGASLDPSATLVEILVLLGLACAFLLGAKFGGSPQVGPLMLYGLVAIVTGVAVLGLILAAVREETRLAATYVSPNTAGTIFGAGLVLALNLMAAQLRRLRKKGSGLRVAVMAVMCIALAAALMGTASRGALLATAAGAAVSLAPQLWRRSEGGKAQISLLVVASLALMLFAFAGGGVIDRLSTSVDQIDARGELFAHSTKLFLRSPLLGYGLGTFDLASKINLDLAAFPKLWSIRSAHNVFLQWLLEAGALAAIPMFSCVALIIGRAGFTAFKGVRERSLLWALLGADLVFIIHGIGDFALQTPAVAVFWSVLLGLQFGLCSQGERRRAKARAAPLRILAGLALGGSLMAVCSLVLGGAVRAGPFHIAPLAAGYDRAATRLLAEPELSDSLDRAAALSERALKLSPYDTSAALRLAYIDALQNGAPTARGLTYFRQSYERVPLDQAVASWRIRFALQNWAALDPKTQAAARLEFEALMATRSHRTILLEALSQVNGGQGALIATFWAARVGRAPV